jgi:hypothetical protein
MPVGSLIANLSVLIVLFTVVTSSRITRCRPWLRGSVAVRSSWLRLALAERCAILLIRRGCKGNRRVKQRRKILGVTRSIATLKTRAMCYMVELRRGELSVGIYPWTYAMIIITKHGLPG